MLKIIEKNKLFLGLYVVAFFGLFFNEINKPLLYATLFFSDHRSAFGDAFFSYWTLLGEAYPYGLVALFFYFYKKDKQNAVKMVLAGLIVVIIAGILKDFFDFPRPINFLDQRNLSPTFNYVQGIEISTGNTSFPSGHTASAFALWGLMAFQFSQYRSIQIGLFLTACLVGISRIYLTQHFPQDVLLGSAIGVGVALLIEYYLGRKQRTVVETGSVPPQYKKCFWRLK
jgi:membrane-associated phospholipid phosphatase